jgi:hypothetical protein
MLWRASITAYAKALDQRVDACIKCKHGITTACSTSCTLRGVGRNQNQRERPKGALEMPNLGTRFLMQMRSRIYHAADHDECDQQKRPE